jgi:hypothetical protein
MADAILILMADISIWEGLCFLQSLAIQSSEPNRDSVSDESRCVGRFTFRSRCPASIVYRAEGMICNLSTGGCAIRTMSSYHHGEEILLVLVLSGAGQVAIRGSGIFSGPRPGETGSRFLFRSADVTKLVKGIATY